MYYESEARRHAEPATRGFQVRSVHHKESRHEREPSRLNDEAAAENRAAHEPHGLRVHGDWIRSAEGSTDENKSGESGKSLPIVGMQCVTRVAHQGRVLFDPVLVAFFFDEVYLHCGARHYDFEDGPAAIRSNDRTFFFLECQFPQFMRQAGTKPHRTRHQSVDFCCQQLRELPKIKKVLLHRVWDEELVGVCNGLKWVAENLERSKNAVEHRASLAACC